LWVYWRRDLRVVAIEGLFPESMLCCSGCGVYVVARLTTGQARVKNMMCSGLWGGGGVVSESAVTKPITARAG
jgi:hypothetical protein